MLRRAEELDGFALAGTDGDTGHAREAHLDDERWVVGHLVVDAGGWPGGRDVLICARADRRHRMDRARGRCAAGAAALRRLAATAHSLRIRTLDPACPAAAWRAHTDPPDPPSPEPGPPAAPPHPTAPPPEVEDPPAPAAPAPVREPRTPPPQIAASGRRGPGCPAYGDSSPFDPVLRTKSSTSRSHTTSSS